MIKMALLNVHKATLAYPQLQTKLRATVHDSIIVTCPAEHAETTAHLLKRIMEDAAKAIVPGIYIPSEIDIIRPNEPHE